MGNSKKKKWKKVFLVFMIIIIAIPVTIFGIDRYMIKTQEGNILFRVEGRDSTITQQVIDEIKEKNPDCVMVLGALANSDGSPSFILKDRLDVGIELYKRGAAPKLLLSGDHGRAQYDEVNAMKKYAIDAGIPKEDLFLDHAGFSTYESVYRAKVIFQVETMITVTQSYHQYRTLYGCKRMGVNAWGVAADQMRYSGQDARDLREIAARNKDFFKWIIKPKPTYIGEAIPISGSGIPSQD